MNVDNETFTRICLSLERAAHFAREQHATDQGMFYRGRIEGILFMCEALGFTSDDLMTLQDIVTDASYEGETL